MKCFSKAIVSCAIAFTLVSPARAALGTTFGAAPAVIVGIVAMGASLGGTYGGYRLIKNGKPVLGGLAIVGSLAVGVFGLMLLDGHQEAKFSELTPKGAQNLGIAPHEAEIYNSEVEQVNAIAREISVELERQNSQAPELAGKMWKDLGEQLSPETIKTLVAIVEQM